MCTIYIQRREKIGEEVLSTRTSQFQLIDLAGYERLKSTNAIGERLKEASLINISLTHLGQVIRNLQSGKSVFYRNSILTHLLKDSLGGNSKSTFIACVSPCSTSYDETLNTILFTHTARKVTVKSSINVETSSSVAQGTLAPSLLQERVQMSKELDECKQEIARLKLELHKQAENVKVLLHTETNLMGCSSCIHCKIKGIRTRTRATKLCQDCKVPLHAGCFSDYHRDIFIINN